MRQVDLECRKIHPRKYRIEHYFDTYPQVNERVKVHTVRGSYMAKYEKWDWSDQQAEPYFSFVGGHSDDVIAWEEE